MVKLIAVDLDGTLLNEENRISQRNLEAIKFAQSNGVEVVIATGRAHFDVQEIFKDTGLKTWIICCKWGHHSSTEWRIAPLQGNQS